jgi:hypothetical protein
MDQQRQPKITAVTSSGYMENEPPRAKKKGGFGKFLKKIFVENWYLKLSAVALAILGWVLIIMAQ